jgi:predicted esterase
MEKHFITVKKTARFFTIGTLNEETTHIWFLIHGYAQTAENLIAPFESLGSNHFIIAPEGLNKFYSRGFRGTPVASWMTSLEREHEIEDYLSYLTQLSNEMELEKFGSAKKILLGFSQGVSTQTRFANYYPGVFDYLILVAGEIAKEFQEIKPPNLFKVPTLFLVGDEEQLIDEEKIQNQARNLSLDEVEFIRFRGKHEVNIDTIEKALKFVNSRNLK